jgi:hypothetical protein
MKNSKIDKNLSVGFETVHLTCLPFGTATAGITVEEDSMVDDIVEEVKVKIPVAVMGGMLRAAARAVLSEDLHTMIELDADEFAFFSSLITRCVLNSPEITTKDWVKDELESFWREFEPHDDKPTPNTD